HQVAADLLAQGNLRAAGIGPGGQRQVDATVRGDQIRWLGAEEPPAVQVFTQRADALVQYLNQVCYAGLADYEMHYAVYPPGTFYQRHLDRFRSDDRRRFSLICYLNPADWQPTDGGQLRLYLPTGPLDVLPTGGTLVCFKSDWLEHEVLPAHRARYSLTGWLRGR
nr:2OG-Fe(II) oxygenase [Bernardetiaceae bacterium]